MKRTGRGIFSPRRVWVGDDAAVKTIKPRASGPVALLLGAGASTRAGLPDTSALVSGLLESPRLSVEQRIALTALVDRLRSAEIRVDIETLLDAITRLELPEEVKLTKALYEGARPATQAGGLDLSRMVQSFIREQVTVRERDRVSYLLPLAELIELYRPLDIFSVNYDNCIELLCRTAWKSFRTGFAPEWRPETLGDENVDVRLMKLHGSITWYYSDGRYIESSIAPAAENLDLSSASEASPLLLYPLQKWHYSGPLWDLVGVLKRRLASAATRWFVVVGYSFRDDPIRQVLWESAESNRGLHVLLIDPYAENIYRSRLKSYPNGAPSALDSRVIRLPYLIEAYLPLLRGELRTLDTAFKKRKSLREQELADDPMRPSPGSPLALEPTGLFCEAEFTDLASFELLRTKNLARPVEIRLVGKVAASLAANCSSTAGAKVQRLHELLSDFLVHSLDIVATAVRSERDWRLSLMIRQSGASSTASIRQYSEDILAIHELSKFICRRVEAMDGRQPGVRQLQAMAESVAAVGDRITRVWPDESIRLTAYLRNFSSEAGGAGLDPRVGRLELALREAGGIDPEVQQNVQNLVLELEQSAFSKCLEALAETAIDAASG